MLKSRLVLKKMSAFTKSLMSEEIQSSSIRKELDGVLLVIHSGSRPNPSSVNGYRILYWPDLLGNSLSHDQILQVCSVIIRNIKNIDVVIQILAADEEVEYCHELDKENNTNISWHILHIVAEDANKKLGFNVFEVNIESCYLCITVDKHLNRSSELLKCLEELQVTEEELHPDDEFPLEKQLLDQLQIKESEEEKPFYYASQESAAYQLVKRIRFVLAHNYGQPKGDEFATFKDFDFQIYTARSNMLETQTRMRLCHRQSGCFKPEVYNDPRKLGSLANERVIKYVASKFGDKHLAELKKKAENNKDTLFLIVADEAHWGITNSNSLNTVGSNDRFINVWDDEKYSNVIVLLVSATPWNLLTANSRIPETFIAMHKQSGEIVAVNEGQLHHLLDQSGKDVTNDVGPKKELHVIQWTEVFDDHLCKGLLMSLKSPQKLGKEPIWLQIDKTDRADIGHKRHLYKWKGSTLQGMQHYFLFQKTERGVEVYSSCQEFILVSVNNSVLHEVGFMHRQDFEKFPKDLCSSFELLLNFGEDVIEIRSAPDRFLKFETTKNCVIQARAPADTKTELGFLYHSPEYSFVVDFRKSPHEINPGKQYLSLNFYFNSMRNFKRTDQLIRDDEDFQQLQRYCKIDFDCLLATDYAYYILLISDLRDFQINAKTLLELIQNPEEYCSKYMNSRKRKMEAFCEELANASDAVDNVPKPVSLEMFQKMCGCIESVSLSSLRDCATWLSKLKNLNQSHSEQLARDLIKYILHANHDSFAKNIKELEQSLRSGGDNGMLSTISRNLQKPLKQFFDESKNLILQNSETFNIIDDLVVQTPPSSGIFGKMKVVRVSKLSYGNQFYATMVIARKVAEKVGFFEVIRYFNKLTLDDARKTKSVHRVWQVLQRKECQFHSQQSYQRCPCKNYKTQDDDLTCENCRHEHSQINQFIDLDRLPCILILVDKGRLGDTFPPSFNTMDLRASHNTQPPVLATLMQELGRLCRYQPKTKYSELPYALVGRMVMKKLKESLNRSAAFTSSCNKVDIHAQKKSNQNLPNTNLRSNGGMQKSMRPQIEASKSSYDFNNTTKFRNRLLLQAEPQIGKTGVFLKTIAILREQICCHSNIAQEDLTTDSEDSGSDSEDETIQQVVFKQDDWKFPFWKYMRDGKKLKTKIESSKYSAVYGPYEHKVTPEYVLYSAKKRKAPKALSECLTIENKGKYRAFSYQEHNRTGQCLDCRVSTGYTTKLAMVAGREIKVSVPQLKRFEPLLDKLQSLTVENAQTDSEREEVVLPSNHSLSLDTWIFNPTYGRSEDATINYSHCMVSLDSGQKCQYIQILVVRSEDFDAYLALWQSTHALVELPSDFDGCDVDTSMGGIGFARLFIQRFAETLQLPKIFVLDDNIYRLHQIVTEISPSGESLQKIDQQGRKLVKEIPFFKMLKHMESQFVCASAPKQLFHSCVTQYSCKCSLSESGSGLHGFTGPNEIYGVLGVLRLRPNARRVKHPFKKTHVCSLVLLNIETLKQNGIRYQPWQVHEDLNLNNDCDTRSLIVCKYNQYLMSKKQMKTWIPEVYEWPDKVILLPSDELLEAVTGEGDCMLRWVRSTAAPKCLNIVLVDGMGRKMIAHEKYSEVLQARAPLRTLLTGLLNVKLGRHHTVAFTCDDPMSSVSHVLSSIKEYFCQTAGIGGFTRHILILPVDLCQKLSLVDPRGFQTRLISAVFCDDVKVKLFSSHNIQHYQISFVVILVLGNSKQLIYYDFFKLSVGKSDKTVLLFKYMQN